MKRINLKVGDKVYLRTGKSIEDGEITKKGRKYIHVKIKYETILIDIFNMKGINSRNEYYSLYLSKEEIENELNYEVLFEKVYEFFRNSSYASTKAKSRRLSLENLKKIMELLEDKKNAQ